MSLVVLEVAHVPFAVSCPRPLRVYGPERHGQGITVKHLY